MQAFLRKLPGPRALLLYLGWQSPRVRLVWAAGLGLLIALLVATWAEGVAWAAEPGVAPPAPPPPPAATPSAPTPAATPSAPTPAAAPSASAAPVPDAAPAVTPATPAATAAPAATTAAPVASAPLSDEQREQQEEAAQEAAERKQEQEEERREEEEERAEAEHRDGPGTLLGGKDGKIDFGGYGGITLLGTQVANQWGFMMGGEAGLLLDHRFSIGGAGYWLTSKVRGPRFPDDTASVLGFGYGGLLLHYQIVGDGPIYLSLGSLIGGGAIALFEYSEEEGLEFNDDEQSANGFFVVEPSVKVHANLTRWMRLGLDGAYRFVHGVNSYGFEEKDFRGWSFGGHMQFGWF